jgi:hypothetical protein
VSVEDRFGAIKMSGGHFNDNNYIYYRVYEFADELESDIQNNDRVDDPDYYSPRYSKEVIDYLKPKVEEIRKMAKLMKEIDYLYSGDHGEDSFMRIMRDMDNK